MWLPLAIVTTINLHLQSDLTAINTDLSTTTNRGTIALFTPSGLIVAAVGDLLTFIAAMPQPQEREEYRTSVTESVGYLVLKDSNQVQCVLQPDDRSMLVADPDLFQYAYIPQSKYSVQPVPVYTPQPLVKYVSQSHVLEDYMQTPTFGMSSAISNTTHLPHPRLHTGAQHCHPWYFAYYDGISYA
ncbi:hypothetical protein CHS0354_004784 [Potamilus streckersoni]|uniref:Uncharacterized protein n=1 Tax=Potamilus streckersoni TaxID=2493646 RepID=A0AAE0TDB8_9BIVA|nr:hypothetical protein CHS0354_004784 [Potamilus streckersoni]